MASIPDIQRIFPCVCGAEVRLETSAGAGLQCPQCGRKIAEEMVRTAGAEMSCTIIGRLPDDDDSLPVATGDQLDHFTLLEPLGAGGMGAVFRARDESLQRFVAIKVIKGQQAGSLRRDRLLQEARAQARVNHPGVVHIYFVGIHHDCPFFAMELVQGQSLSQMIRNQRLSFADTARVALETAEALAHSASLGIVHGDVKPSNILIRDNGHIKLSDFGLSSYTDKPDAESSSSGPAGTLNYMAPEVAAGQVADIRSDMYSLGIMLYEMTFGALPLQASSESLEENLRQRQTATIRFPEKWPADRPEDWKEVLEKLLAKRPEDRFADYDDLVIELRKWQQNAVVPAGRISRAISMFLDTSMVGIFFGITQTVENEVGTTSYSIGKSLYSLPALAITTALIWWMVRRWGCTPGKKLMQLRIVDQFGIRPSRSRLIAKVVGTYALFLTSRVRDFGSILRDILGMSFLPSDEILGITFGICASLWVVVNGFWLLISRQRQTLYDKLLKLRVVLDVPVSSSDQKAARRFEE
ncbi:MAG: protein kinase [Planctomyces sp.]|nr:protein kinase [Planctomyces sp.]